MSELNLTLYYSINELIKNCDIDNLLQDNSRNSFTLHKTILWGDNDINYGEIFFNLEIKYDDKMNYYTYGNIIIVLHNNNKIEFILKNKGCKLDLLTNKYNII